MQALQDYQQRFNDLVNNDLPERKPIDSLPGYDPRWMKEGYLQKKGQRLKGWKRRWFVCDGRTMSYYIHRKDRKPNAVIPLEGSTVQDGGISETWNSPRIYLTDGTNGVMYCLSAEEGEVVTQWLTVLRNAIAKVSGEEIEPTASSATATQEANGKPRGPIRSDSSKVNVDDDTKIKRQTSVPPSSALQRTTQLKSSASSSNVLNEKRTARLVSAPVTSAQAGEATKQASPPPGSSSSITSSHPRSKIQHLSTNVKLENELAQGLDVLESLLSSHRNGSLRTRSPVVFRPIAASNGVLRSIGTDTLSGKMYARASVVLPVSSEVAAYLLSDHAKRAEWDLHFPQSTHVATFDDTTDLVHLSGGFQQLTTTKPFLTPQMAAAACSIGAVLASGAWEGSLLTNALYGGVIGGVVNSIDYSALCVPRDLLLLRHVRETAVVDKDDGTSNAAARNNHDGEELGQSVVLILEKSVVNELKPPVANVVRAHVGLSGWLLEPIDSTCTIATYVTDLDMKGWLSPETKKQFLIQRLECVAVFNEYVNQSQLISSEFGLADDEASVDGNNKGDITDDDYADEVDSYDQGASSYFHPKAYMRGMMRLPSGGLKLIDKEIAKKQGGVLKDVIKSAGAKILEGKSAVSLSLPVRIFEPRTNLERVCDLFLFGPTFLNTAADQTDPVERFKYVMAFAVAGLHHSVGQLKPFNPILGETYQAMMNDGTEVCCEHTSHHPPISNFQVMGKKYSIAGHVLWHATFSMKSNALLNTNKGPVRVSFGDGTTIVYNMPYLQIGGFLWGDRSVEILGTMTFEDTKNHLMCELRLNPDEKKGMGGMFSSSKTPTDQVRGVIVNTETNTELCEVTGSWLDDLRFAEKAYWNIKRDQSGYLVPYPENKILASDSRHREDLKALGANDLDDAQEWKVRLEVLQRADRKIRNDGRRPNHWSLQEDKHGH